VNCPDQFHQHYSHHPLVVQIADLHWLPQTRSWVAYLLSTAAKIIKQHGLATYNIIAYTNSHIPAASDSARITYFYKKNV